MKKEKQPKDAKKQKEAARDVQEIPAVEEKVEVQKTEKEETTLAPARGTRDFLFEDKILRDEILGKLKETFELYGFNAFETPAFERWEVLSSKYAGGAEILKETYTFEDQGERKLGLRYDLTVPMCRVIAGNPALPLPIKRYAIGSVWRDGPLKLGRYREFTQCDADIAGVKSGLADAECIALLCDGFNKLNIDFVIKVNNRKLLEGLLETLGVPTDKLEPSILSIDKLAKIGSEGVEKELIEKDLPISTSKKVVETIMELTDLPREKLLIKCEKLLAGNEKAKAGLTELEEVFDYLDGFGKTENVMIDVSLARGLSYYTGTILEAFARNSQITSSIASGGRYDELIGKFAGRETIPAVGVSFGLDVIGDVIRLGGKGPKRKSNVEVFVIPIKTIPKCTEVSAQLRASGVRTAVDLMGRSISKNLEYASKQGITYVAIIGMREAEQNKVTLRNLQTGEEKLLSVEEATEIVKKARL